MGKKLTIEDAKKIAESYHGACVSEEYRGSQKKLRWRCKNGHEWNAKYNSVQQGHWCPDCKKLGISLMRDIAKARGGSCLSERYINNHSKLKWQCAKLHVWDAMPSNIINGTWCPECAGQGKYTIERLCSIARERGGECLSKVCGNARKKVDWKCSVGHSWSASPGSIVAGHWCPECESGRGERLCRAAMEQIFGHPFPRAYPKWLKTEHGNQMELDGYCEELGLAFEHQGMQHYVTGRRFSRTQKELEKRILLDSLKMNLCNKHNVVLIAIPEVGTLTPLEELVLCIARECAKRNVIAKKGVKVDYAQAFSKDDTARHKELSDVAAARGGRLLSSQYLGWDVKMEWECEHGHTWFACPNRVDRGETWCPKCAGRNDTIADVKARAIALGGACLSNEYLGSKTKLLFQCGDGHKPFEMTFNSIKQGHWCPHCAGNARPSIKDLRKLASKKGGRLLSTKYINARDPLEWECRMAHRWKASAANVKSGSWCPTCAGNTPLTIDAARLVAAAHGGKCLSLTMRNAHDHLQWRCAVGHEWSSEYNSVKKGQWCPDCAGNRRKTIYDMQTVAKERGGKCLSTQYKNNKTLMTWQCANGHVWDDTPDRVMNRGRWCHQCKAERTG